jgi:acyl carrier protein
MKGSVMPDTAHVLTAEQDEQLRAIIIEVLELEPEDLTDTSSFVDDHDADSLLAIEILARIEKELGVTIPQDDLTRMRNLDGVRTVVAGSLKAEHDV